MKQYPTSFESYDSMEGIAAIEASAPPRRFESWPQAKLIHAIYPGVLVAGTIALASTWLAQHYTAPVMLFALLFGMSFHFLHEGGRCVAGIEFASRSLLRLGVAVLGMRMTLGEIASLGIARVLTVAVGVASTILIGSCSPAVSDCRACSEWAQWRSAAPPPPLRSLRSFRATRTASATRS